jgi:hypothetical protein
MIVMPQNNVTNRPHHQGFSILSRPQQPSGMKGVYADCAKNFDDCYSATTAPMTDYASSNGSYDANSFYHSNSSFENIPNTQNSYSDSSTEGAMDRRMFQPAQPFPNNRDNGVILPPLPAQAFRTEPIPSGPNPYALKVATQQQQQQQPPRHHQDNFYPQHPSMQRDSMYMPAPARQQPLPQTTTATHFFNNNNNSNNNHSHNNNNNNAPQNYGNQNHDYRAERLEKQRQTVVGGSLFVTSPRSFLLGLRNTDVVSNQ